MIQSFFLIILSILGVCLFYYLQFKALVRRNYPGNHRCWQCNLYDPHQKACSIIIYPKKVLAKTNAFRKCIWHKTKMTSNIQEFNVDKELYKVKKELEDYEKSKAEQIDEHNIQM